MARAKCCICEKEDDTQNLYFCSDCHTWVHFGCGDGEYNLIFGDRNPKCPNCHKELKKKN